MNNFLPDVPFQLRADGKVIPNRERERPGVFHRGNSTQENHALLVDCIGGLEGYQKVGP